MPNDSIVVAQLVINLHRLGRKERKTLCIVIGVINCVSTLHRLGGKEKGAPSSHGLKMSDKEAPSRALAFFSCAIPCLAALSQGVLLCWLNPVLPQVREGG